MSVSVSFVGLGSMGHPMARNLVNAGHVVNVWNRTAAKADDLVNAGAKRVGHPADAARERIVITMVSDDAALEQVLFTDGLMDALTPGAIHVSMSTISVALAKRLATEHASRGSVLVSAPVMGRPDAAADARLFILAAGPDAAIDACQPLFDAMGQRTFRFGAQPDAANTMKLAVNFLLSAMIESLAESCVLAKKSGVDPHDFVDLLTNTLFGSPVYKTYGALIADGRYWPAGFPVPLALKDLSLVLDASRTVAAPLPLAALVRDRLVSAMAQGFHDADWSALGAIAERSAGL